jgi:hypothetical protein
VGRAALLAGAALVVLSCASVQLQPGVKVIDLQPGDFTREYYARRNEQHHADYIGIRDRYHYMAIYDADPGSNEPGVLRYYVRAPMNEMATGFPEEPQQPMPPASSR